MRAVTTTLCALRIFSASEVAFLGHRLTCDDDTKARSVCTVWLAGKPKWLVRTPTTLTRPYPTVPILLTVDTLLLQQLATAAPGLVRFKKLS